MAAATRTVRVRFDGDAKGLAGASGAASAALEGMQRNAVKASQGFQTFVTRAAMLAPVIGGVLGMAAGLSGVLGFLPGVALAGGLAMGALKIGTAGFGDAIKAMGDPAKFAEAIAKLSPAARAAALAVQSLKPQLDGLKTAVQDRLFAGFAEQIRGLGTSLLPMLQGQLVAVAGSMNATAVSFMSWLRMPGTVRDLGTALNGSRGFLNGILAAALPVTQALLDIGVVAAPYLSRLGELIANAAFRFRDFVASARESGQLGAWIQQGVDTFASLWNVLKMVAQAVWNIAVAFGSSGLPTVLELVALALLKVSQFIRDNAAVMVPLITVIGLLVFAFKSIMLVVGIVNAIRSATILWTAAQWLLNAAFLANPITWVILAIVALIAIIVLLVVHWDTVKAACAAVVDWLVTKWTLAKTWLGAIWAAIKATALAIWNAVTAWIGAKVDAMLAFIRRIGAIPGQVGAWFGQMRDAAISRAQALVAWVSSLPGRIRSALGNLGSLLVGAGRAVVDGFLSGLQSTWNRVLGWAQSAMASLRSFWPFSPAKTGPFSGTGYVTYSGKALAGDFAGSLSAGTPAVERAARALTAAAQSATTPTLTASTSAAGLTAGPQIDAAGMNGQGSGPTPVEVSVYIDGTEFKGMIRTEINEENRALRRAVGV